MDNTSFVADGFLFTRCITRGGKRICKPNGFYRIPISSLKKPDDNKPDDANKPTKH